VNVPRLFPKVSFCVCLQIMNNNKFLCKNMADKYIKVLHCFYSYLFCVKGSKVDLNVSDAKRNEKQFRGDRLTSSRVCSIFHDFDRHLSCHLSPPL
jgi:hypothetical protein